MSADVDAGGDPLLALMAALTLALAAGVGWAVYSFWRTRRQVAWNVVNAALVLRGLGQAEVAALEQAALAQGLGTAHTLQGSMPVVRLAVLSMAMQRQGMTPFDPAHPFRPLRSALLARSAVGHVRTVRTLVELQHGLSLPELDGV